MKGIKELTARVDLIKLRDRIDYYVKATTASNPITRYFRPDYRQIMLSEIKEEMTQLIGSLEEVLTGYEEEVHS